MSSADETFCDKAFVEQLDKELSAGRSFVLIGVAATKGSMPRAAGARMAALSDGTFIGTVGGGRVEQMAQERASRILAGAEGNAIAWYTHAVTKMACGGDALLTFRKVVPEDSWRTFLEGILARLEGGISSVLEEDWSDPALPTISCTDLDDLPEGDLRATLDVASWDEERKIYRAPLGPDPICYVFGAGHVGQALVPVLAHIDFRVVVLDDRQELARPELFPDAEDVRCGSFGELARTLPITSRDYCVVATHGHVADIEVLEGAMRKRPAYVGCIGSRGKAAFVKKTLEEAGVPGVERLHLPIGEDILAVTPAEIAISIAAQLIRCRAELRPERPHSH